MVRAGSSPRSFGDGRQSCQVRILDHQLLGIVDKRRALGEAVCPAALKNAVDLLYPEWNHKAVGFVSHGADGGVRAVEQWRTIVAYSIPVSVHSVFGVIGSSSAANTTALTPGAVGVTQAANAAALGGYTSASTAVDYSLTQQFLVTAVNCCYALVLVVIVFGWRGGRKLVSEAYAEARTRKTETGPAPAANGSGEADRS